MSVLLSQSAEKAELDGITPKLLKLIEKEHMETQRNAVAALSAAVESSDVALSQAIADDAAVILVRHLGHPGLALNVLAALGTLAEGSPEGARSVVTAGGVEAALRWCQVRGGDGTAEKEQQAQGEVLQEAALDGLCKVLGQGQEFREEVAERGGIPVLGTLLVRAASSEVRVRCLLALGMAVGGSPERQVQLAGCPGVAGRLVGLMRSEDDADCQHIAAGIFGELAKNSEAKQQLTAALKDAGQ